MHCMDNSCRLVAVAARSVQQQQSLQLRPRLWPTRRRLFLSMVNAERCHFQSLHVVFQLVLSTATITKHFPLFTVPLFTVPLFHCSLFHSVRFFTVQLNCSNSLFQLTVQAPPRLPVAKYRGADETSLLQLVRMPWHRQLELVADNEHCDLPGIVEGGVPSENLLWVLVGFDMDAATFPKTQRFNAEERWLCFASTSYSKLMLYFARTSHFSKPPTATKRASVRKSRSTIPGVSACSAWATVSCSF